MAPALREDGGTRRRAPCNARPGGQGRTVKPWGDERLVSHAVSFHPDRIAHCSARVSDPVGMADRRCHDSHGQPRPRVSPPVEAIASGAPVVRAHFERRRPAVRHSCGVGDPRTTNGQALVRGRVTRAQQMGIQSAWVAAVVLSSRPSSGFPESDRPWSDRLSIRLSSYHADYLRHTGGLCVADERLASPVGQASPDPFQWAEAEISQPHRADQQLEHPDRQRDEIDLVVIELTVEI